MRGLNTKYRFAAFVLLTAILSHITLFHFSLEQKVLCKDKGEIFHIENIANHNSQVENKFHSLNLNNNENNFGTDYKLDVHVDQNIVKSNYNFSLSSIGYLKPDYEKTTKNKKLNNYANKDFYAANTVLKSLSTITLII